MLEDFNKFESLQNYIYLLFEENNDIIYEGYAKMKQIIEERFGMKVTEDELRLIYEPAYNGDSVIYEMEEDFFDGF